MHRATLEFSYPGHSCSWGLPEKNRENRLGMENS